MRVIVFGIGLYYHNRKSKLSRFFIDNELVCFADNRANEIKEFEGKEVICPNKIKTINYDAIIIMSKQYDDIYNQLLTEGVNIEKIYSYERILPLLERGIIEYHIADEITTKAKKILFITSDLGFNGGSYAVLYAAYALKERGFYVCVATAKNSNEGFIAEINKERIDVILFRSFPYIGGNDFRIIDKFDVVIANVFQTINCVHECYKRVPVLWWIHEANADNGIIYTNTISKYPQILSTQWMNRVRTISVSKAAKRAFEFNCKKRIDAVIPLGIQNDVCDNEKSNRNKIVIANIGLVNENKAQNIYVSAIKKIIDSSEHTEFWIIGPEPDTKYVKDLKHEAELLNKLHFFGEKNKDEIKNLYSEIDVVVCSSLVESMSMTIIEGMMNSKICITTDNTGIADYIEDGVNGFICKAGDVDSLREKMQYVIEHFSELDDMRKKARQTYEKYFTLEVLGDNLEREINIAIKEFEERK